MDRETLIMIRDANEGDGAHGRGWRDGINAVLKAWGREPREFGRKPERKGCRMFIRRADNPLSAVCAQCGLDRGFHWEGR
jgi:hypothetical protein